MSTNTQKLYQKMQTCKIGLKYFCSLLKKFFFKMNIIPSISSLMFNFAFYLFLFPKLSRNLMEAAFSAASLTSINQ